MLINLGILDQAVISDGESAEQALKNSIELAQTAEQLGYKRYWIAEHHGNKYFANSSPEVLMSSIAAQTEKIKVGSGGILLQHYSPYKIAENLKLLNTLYPNRIEAGFGRTPGGEDIATRALQGNTKPIPYDIKVKETVNYLRNKVVEVDNEELIVSPISDDYPEVWLLGSRMRSAEIAANEGLSFAFGHFLTPDEDGKAINYYIDNFKPSKYQKEPNTILCINVICAESDEKCEEIAKSHDLMTVLLKRGENPDGTPNPADYNKFIFTDEEKELIEKSRKELIMGTPKKVKDKIVDLSKKYKTKDFLILTITFNHYDRLNSYKLLMEEMKNVVEEEG